MPGSMPYILDRGPYFSVVESMLANPAKRADALLKLRHGQPEGVAPPRPLNTMLAEMCGFDSTNLGRPDNPSTPADEGFGDRMTEADRKDHLNEDWFGIYGNPLSKHPGDLPTGFWEAYQGDPEAILREGMIRAIEVSFGINHNAAPPVDAIEDWNQATATWPSGHASAIGARHWPIEVTWICQGPWFQCWITWLKTDNTETGGHVNLLIATPAAVGPNTFPLSSYIERPLPDGTLPPKPDYAADPPGLGPALGNGAQNEDEGVWVVGHRDHRRIRGFTTKASRPREMPQLILHWTARDPQTNTFYPVVCVRPAFWEGGVLNAGFPYTP